MRKGSRLMSLDAFRGFDMFWIMGGEELLCAIVGLFGVSGFHKSFGHVPWEGLHFMDTVFPTFLFMAGVSFPFSAAKSLERGMTRGHPYADARRWFAQARAAAEGDAALAARYETDARRLITVWGKNLGDYSARVWSGLLGDYYLRRLEVYWQAKDAGEDPAAAVGAFSRRFVAGEPPCGPAVSGDGGAR